MGTLTLALSQRERGQELRQRLSQREWEEVYAFQASQTLLKWWYRLGWVE